MTDNNEQVNAEEDKSLNMNLVDEDSNNEPITPEVSQEPAQEVDPYLEEATQYGYDPNYQGPNKKSTKEFVQYGKNYQKESIKAIKDKLSKIEQQNQELIEERKRNALEAVRMAKDQLTQQMIQAKAHGDTTAVENLTVRKLQLEQQERAKIAERLARDEADANAQFVQRNSHWFNDSRPELKAEAVQLGQEVFKDMPNLSYAEAALRVENMMKWKHPEISVPQNVAPMHIPVNQSNVNKSVAQSSVNTNDIRSLTPDQQAEYKAAKAIVERGNERRTDKQRISYTVSDYVKAINKPDYRG